MTDKIEIWIIIRWAKIKRRLFPNKDKRKNTLDDLWHKIAEWKLKQKAQ